MQNYYNLSNIPCEFRQNDKNIKLNNEELCTGLNPDKIYSSLFPTSGNSVIPSKYNEFYSQYPKEGNIGDYFCKFVGNKCYNDKYISCKNYKKPQPENQPAKINPNKILSNQLCVPPLPCSSQNDIKSMTEQLVINNKPFYECEKDNEFCIDNIYTRNKFGNPTDQNIPESLLYSETYLNPFKNDNNNKNYITCPIGYETCKDSTMMCCKVVNNKTEKCHPPENKDELSNFPSCNIPSLEIYNAPVFDNVRQCQNWCAKNPNCSAIVKTLDRNGNMNCTYFKYNTTPNQISIQKIKDNKSIIFQKRKHPYIANPPKDKLSLFDGVNMNTANFLCADGTRKINYKSKNMKEVEKECKPFTKNTGLIGDPANFPFKFSGDKINYNYNSLGGTTKMGKINTESGSSFLGMTK